MQDSIIFFCFFHDIQLNMHIANPMLVFSDATSAPGTGPVYLGCFTRREVVPENDPFDNGTVGQTTVERRTCKICRRILASPSALRLHLRTHTGQRPHVCEICQRAFAQKGTLRSHMLTHADVGKDNL